MGPYWIVGGESGVVYRNQNVKKGNGRIKNSEDNSKAGWKDWTKEGKFSCSWESEVVQIQSSI